MTRAALLSLLAHPTALTGADVHALEALAAAFPYCQTAHLLLAKAAHDQDSMLAGQRLRRAATYAADRALLRQLMESPAEPAPLAAAVTTALPESITARVTATTAPVLLASPPPALPLPVVPATAATLADQPDQEIQPAFPAAPAVAPVASEELTTPPAATEPVAATLADSPAAPPSAPDSVSTDAAPTSLDETTEAASATTTVELAATAAEAARATLPTADEPASVPVVDAPVLAEAEQPSPRPTEVEEAAEFEAELPAQAPLVRPPEQAEAARHEFGLAPDEPATLVPYQLPELELAITVPLAPAVATPRLPAFSGVTDVAYAPGEGSRLGFCLVPAAPTQEVDTAAAPTAPLIPPANLPPAGEFFAPDALLTSHVAAPPTPAASQLDLINSFLQRDPAMPRRRGQPGSAPSEQPDLSVRSTRPVPELASESLAVILAKQGKKSQAIAIYERLMVKNPERSAYFAAQIDLLRPTSSGSDS